MHKKIPIAVKVYCGNHSLLFGFVLQLIVGRHYKLEITYPNLDVLKNIKYKINYYEPPKGKGRFYVCWPKFISKLEDAMNILIVWSAASSYTILYGKDSRNFFANKKLIKGDFSRLLSIFEKRYGIITKIIIPQPKINTFKL